LFPIRDLNPTRIAPVVTILVIGLNVAAFFFWQPQTNEEAAAEFLYERAAVACELTTGEPLSETEIVRGVCSDDPEPAVFAGKNVWLAGLASMFFHGGLFHILSNMWFLWIFGNNVEEAYGAAGYVGLYLAAGVAATATFVVLNPSETIPLVGASGAIAGVLGAYLVLYPAHSVLTWFLLFFVPVPAVLFLGFWFISQFTIAEPGVAWEAHVGGFLLGMLVTLPLRAALLRRVRELHGQYRY